MRLRPFLVLAVSVALFLNSAYSQQPVLHWAKVFNARNTYNYGGIVSNGRTVDIDQQGNVYSAGLFQHTVDFDPGAGVYALKGGGESENAIYISKLDANGNFIWAKQIPGLVEFGSVELKVDSKGNVYLASDLLQPVDMDPGPGVHMMTPIGAQDAFVIKLDPKGNLVWVKQFGGPGGTVPGANALDIDKDDNVIICGGFNNTVDFDPGPNTFNLTSTAHIQSYIVKLSSKGDFIWALQFGNGQIPHNDANIADVKCDNYGNIYTTGHYGGTCDFDPGTSVYSLTSTSDRDGFISKLDPNGNFVWVRKIGNTINDSYRFVYPGGIDIDGMNNIVTTGTFTGTHDFDTGRGVQSRSSNGGSYDFYILKLNAQGDFSWAKFIGSSESESGNDVVVDGDNNIYAIGSFGRSVDFDPSPADFTINSPYYGAEALVKLNAQGNFIYAAPFQSIDEGSTLSPRMEINAAGNIYISGYVSGKVDFDPGPTVHPLSGSSYSSPFVLKLGRCTNITTSTLYISSCNSYTLNNELFEKSGTYTQTIPNASGCDSVITLHLTINKKYTEQETTICEGESLFVGGARQTAPGIYKDTLQTIDGCDSIITTNLIVHPKPLPDLGPDRNMCSYDSLSVTPGVFSSYQWQNNSTQNTFTIHTAGLYWVTVTNSDQCTASDTIRINKVLQPPANFLKQKDSICSNADLLLQPFSNFRAYLWSTGATQANILVQTPGKYWLKVKDANGCFGADTITVFSKQCITGVYIPSAFTPNGDGKNDVFKILFYINVKAFELTVYNRWGEVVFKSSERARGWDGQTNGKALDSGVFVWTCRYQLEGQEIQQKKGTVTLIR